MKGLFQSSGRWRTVFIPAAALQPNVQLMQLAEKNQTGRGPADSSQGAQNLVQGSPTDSFLSH